MPRSWKPWLGALLGANMIAPLFGMQHVEARVVFAVSLIQGLMMILLTAVAGFTRIVSLGHILWFPMIWYLCTRLEVHPPTTVHGIWLRITILLDAGSLFIDVANVIRYLAGDREELVDLG